MSACERCPDGCSVDVRVVAGRLVDVDTGWPHRLTCYKRKALRFERTDWCWSCHGRFLHVVSSAGGEELVVCAQCGTGRVLVTSAARGLAGG